MQLVQLVQLMQLVNLVQLVHGRMQFLGKCRSLILNSESTGEL